jgi:hypothetical protein
LHASRQNLFERFILSANLRLPGTEALLALSDTNVGE